MLFVPHVNLALVVIILLTKNNNLGEDKFDWYVQLNFPCSKLFLDIYKVPSTCFMQTPTWWFVKIISPYTLITTTIVNGPIKFKGFKYKPYLFL